MDLERIDHLVITVKNIKDTIDFYIKVLNMQELTVRRKDVEIKALRFGNQRIHVHEAGKEIKPKALRATPGSVDICFVTNSSMVEIIKHLKKNNVAIEKAPLVIPGTLGDMESIWFRDPDGNLIEISKYL
jgi:catechol 2,3-dioxygenase-like lactoylglutathione lyase family enzyme